MTNEESLERVRGQLAMVAEKNKIIEREVLLLKSSKFLVSIIKKTNCYIKETKNKVTKDIYLILFCFFYY